MTGVTEDELMAGHRRHVKLADLSELERRRLMHERIREAEERAERLLEALTWIAEYGTRDGDLRDGHETAIRQIALNTVLAERGEA